MKLSFTPSPDVVVILNALLDKFEKRAKHNRSLSESEETYDAGLSSKHSTRRIKVNIIDLPLPTYFSQTDPEPRTIANQQLQTLEKHGHVKLDWLSGESGHLLQSITLKTEHASRSTHHESLYQLLNRTSTANHRANLESIILAEKFRYQKSDWRARALDCILTQLHVGKSPSPFSLTDSDFNHDLLAVLQALSTLTAETPYRVFSVHVFNDTKRFDDLKPALIRLTRRAHFEWKSLNNEDLLRELNLVANPGYIHLSGNWELTDANGQIIHLDAFTPSVGFPASQIETIQKITIRAESILCIENLTSFHEFTRAMYTGRQVDTYTGKQIQTENETNNLEPETWNVELETRLTPHATRHTSHATICLMGNPSPSIRRLLQLIPEETPISLWSDMDYGGVNILAQLRKQVSPRVQPYLMDIATFENYAHFSRPLTQSDTRNLKRLTQNPVLKDIHSTIEHLLQRGLKLEQEAIQS